MNKRDEMLRGVREAAKVLADPPANGAERTSFDVVGAVLDRGIPLLFQPLDRLWGAFVNSGAEKGIVVSSKLALAAQRFTLAHELGHLLLGHESSFDHTVGFAGRNAAHGRNAKEAGADAFAAELLAPRTLLRQAAERHGWSKATLQKPETIYQLALRLGIDYKAACWALVSDEVLPRVEAERLQDIDLKEMRRPLAPLDRDRAWADVWAIGQADSGSALEAGPDALFAVCVADHASAGFVWNLVDAEGDARIVGQSDPELAQEYGDRSRRTIYVEFDSPGLHSLVFEHTRPWSRTTLERIEVRIDDYGKEHQGWSRREKRQALRVVA